MASRTRLSIGLQLQGVLAPALEGLALMGVIEIRTSEHLNRLLEHRARVHERPLYVDRS
jgi:hypothetical protein